MDTTLVTQIVEPINWSMWGVLIAIPALILAFLGLWGLINKASFLKYCWTPLTVVIALFLSTVFAPVLLIIYSIKERTALNLYRILKNREYKKSPLYKRWFKWDKIKFGGLKYPPLLDFSATTDKPFGIGIDLLYKIFSSNKIEGHHLHLTWRKLQDILYEKNQKNEFKIDIIATPIFETNDRSKYFSFSLPIFYSEIGIYYNAENELFASLKDADGLSFQKAIDFINKFKSNIKTYSIEGELSEKMLKKHFKGKVTETKPRGELTVPSLLSSIINDKINSDIVFAETYQAKQLIEGRLNGDGQEEKFKNLKNLLRPRELLYPVVFAMRKEDYVLKNYINLKLIEIDGPGSGINELIKGSLNSTNDNFTKMNEDEKAEFISKYFVREYNHLT